MSGEDETHAQGGEQACATDERRAAGMQLAFVGLIQQAQRGRKADQDAETSTKLAGRTEGAAAKVAEKAIEAGLSGEAANVEIDLDDGSGSLAMNIAGEEGAGRVVMGSAAAIPDDFPKDVPLYPGMSLEMVMAMSEQHSFSIQASTQDALDKVAAHFQGEAGKKGWVEELSMNQGGDQPMSMLNYTKEGRVLNLMLVSDEGQTRISLTTALR